AGRLGFTAGARPCAWSFYASSARRRKERTGARGAPRVPAKSYLRSRVRDSPPGDGSCAGAAHVGAVQALRGSRGAGSAGDGSEPGRARGCRVVRVESFADWLESCAHWFFGGSLHHDSKGGAVAGAIAGKGCMRKRKNFGEGYGYTFHGAFTDKKDAEAKEAKTPGSFIKGSLTQKGYRYLVMKPRKNPARKSKRVLTVGDKKFSRWETARNYAKKQAATFGNRIPVQVRESDGTELTHYVDPPARSNPATKIDRVAKRNQGKASKLYQRMTALLAAGKYDRSDKIKKQLDRLAARMGWSMGYIASFARAENPAELLVMGNPAELVVMGNPGDDPWMLKAAAEIFPGKTMAQISANAGDLSRVARRAAELKRDAGSQARGNSMDWGGSAGNPRVIRPGVRRNAELGEYENGVFFPLTRRPRSRHKSAVRRRRAANPAAADLREAFVG